MNATRFALRNLRREWRAGEIGALLVALAIAVAGMTAVGGFVERVETAMRLNAGEFVGGDLGLSSRQRLPETLAEEARALGLAVAQTVGFPSVVFAAGRSQLADIRAVSEGYPLRGRLRVAMQPFEPGEPTDALPARGEIWVDGRLLAALELAVGERLELGDGEYLITRVLVSEPDASGEFGALAPRLLMRLEDAEESGLLGAGSRVGWRMLFAGPPSAVSTLEARLRSQRPEGSRLLTLEDSQQQIAQAFERARRFLGLSALLAVALAGVAIALAARRFASRHLDAAAVLRCLGAQQRDISRAYGLQLLLLGLPVCLFAAALGLGLQQVVVQAFAALLPVELPPPSLHPALVGLLTGLIVLLGFALPPLAALRRVPPARVLNRGVHGLPLHGALRMLPAALALAGLALWQARDALLAAAVLGALALVAMALALAGLLLVRGLRGATRHSGIVWRFGVAAVARRARLSLVQITGLGLGFTALMLLSVISRDLLAQWQANLPEDTPNYFLLNIQPEQREAAARLLDELGAGQLTMLPLAIGRLTHINGQPPGEHRSGDPRAERWANGPMNLSWSDRLPEANRLREGRFWSPGEAVEEVSIADPWAKALGLGLGDRIGIAVGDRRFDLRVGSVRDVDWDSFRVNFFVLMPPALAEGLGHSHLASFHLPAERAGELSRLASTLPNVSIIDVQAILDRVREIIGQVSAAVRWVLGFSLLAGVTVLVAALQSTRDERLFEVAMLRTLGARQRQILAALTGEFLVLGATAGVVAAAGALAAGQALAHWVFEFRYAPPLWLLPAGAVLGALFIGISGLLGSLGILRTRPAQALRALW